MSPSSDPTALIFSSHVNAEFDHVHLYWKEFDLYKQILERFLPITPLENQTEENFVKFLVTQKYFTRSGARKLHCGTVKYCVFEDSKLQEFLAAASKDASHPITIDLLNDSIFPSTLYLQPACEIPSLKHNYRDAEAQNFADVTALLVKCSGLDHWVQIVKGNPRTKEQLKAKRIWLKGSVLTWWPYFTRILHAAFEPMTHDEQIKMLYRPPITRHQRAIINKCLNRLFNHPMWDQPEGEIDSLLVSARHHDDLFTKYGLTASYIVDARL